MKGRLLDYAIQTNSGIISGDDGNRYRFTGDAWKESSLPQRGMYLDFEVSDTNAIDIYRVAGLSGSTSSVLPGVTERRKERIVAGILGILLGGLGIHKFYLGYNKAGIIHLAVFFIGMIPFGLGTFVIAVIGLIEGIIYLVKTDEEFEQTYVVNVKEWF